VGSIQAWNPWESRKSVAHAKWWVSKVASLSYGNEEAKNPDKLFQSIVDRGHLSCLEFVPRNVVGADGELLALPASSLRAFPESMESGTWNPEIAAACSRRYPASAFLVECPLYARSQWMRHRSFAYLEMSRRYTKGSRVAWEFYGQAPDFISDPDTDPTNIPMGFTPAGETEENHFWKACETEYLRRLNAGWPNEIARGCMPVETMTKFWTCGFDRDWEAFLKLRDDAHAQSEIQVFASWIRRHLKAKKEIVG
jgi:flavin-dependent thymidylate synthase